MSGFPRVGVLGVGRMGRPIALAWAAAGIDVVAWDPDASRLDGLVARDPFEIAGSVEVLVTVLPGAAEAATIGPVLAALRPGAVWLDLTSNDPRVATALAVGLDAVGAPMGGGVQAARDGALKFFAGGTAIDRIRGLLERVGTVEVIGPNLADGYTAKLLANLLWFGQAIAATEALLLGQSLGLPPAALARTLAASAGGSVFLTEHVHALLAGDYLDDFGLDRVVEELEILEELAQEQRIPFELSSYVTRLHREALALYGTIPGELLAAKLLEERAGRTLHVD